MHTIRKQALAASRRHAFGVVRATRKELRIAQAIYQATTLHHHGGQHTLRFVRLLRHPPEKIWRAITEGRELVQWFPLEIHDEYRQVMVSDPPHVLEFSQEGELLRFELMPQEPGTELVFTHTFGDLAKSAREASRWELCFANLEKRLDGKPTAPFSLDRFTEMFAKYAWEFGPDASSKRAHGF